MPFRILVVAGTVFLGAALVIAPVAAFTGHMTTVSALGITGMVLLFAAWLIRRFTRPPRPPDADPPAQ